MANPDPSLVPEGEGETPAFYYVDGYHGGLEGHMPLGCMRDILRELERRPGWKLSLEIEPASWDRLRAEDPACYRAWKARIEAGPEGRVELVSGSFAQAFAWNIGGESNVRQLLRGREILRRHFPAVAVDTYAVQEPCWTSALPGILLSLGYARASLKNPSTCWAGYAAGRDASTLWWVGPDGQAIPAAPRYACEGLLAAWQTESMWPAAGFIPRCRNAGITHPAGMSFQDLGWPALPSLRQGEIFDRFAEPSPWEPRTRYVTWREYFASIAPAPEARWRLAQDDLRVALAWGARPLLRLARAVRKAEDALPRAEKLASLARLWAGAPWPGRELEEAWDLLLWAQHHDAWIVPHARKGGGARPGAWTWGELAEAQAWRAAEAGEALAEAAAAALAPAAPAVGGEGSAEVTRIGGARCVRAFNTLLGDREDLARARLALPPGTAGFRVRDAEGHPLASQAHVRRRYRDGTPMAVDLTFPARLPSLGYADFAVEALPLGGPDAEAADAPIARRTEGDELVLETDLYRIVLDPVRGGALRSLYAKALGREFVPDGARANAFRGYFPDLGRWLDSAEAPAELEVEENGPLSALVAWRGRLGDFPFRARLEAARGRARIGLEVTFEFPPGTRVGEPWEPGRDCMRSRRRPCYDDSHKLQALFPCALERPRLWKGAAFDVCASVEADTHCDSFDDLKHTVLLDWLDWCDGACGLAILAGQTTAYAHGPDRPLGLVLAYGGHTQWNTEYLLEGEHRVEYDLLPHAGDWEAAGLPREAARRREPVLARELGVPSLSRRSAAACGDPAIEATAFLAGDGRARLRLWNASPRSREVTLGWPEPPRGLRLEALDGRPEGELRARGGGGAPWEATLPFPPFGLRTLSWEA